MSRSDPTFGRMVPLTELRHFYRLLRHTLVSTVAQLRIAEEVRRKPDKLQQVVRKSREHFALYDNRGEGFHPRKAVGALSAKVLASQKPVHGMLKRIAKHGIRVRSAPEFDADLVDYELSPIRTTGSEYEDGIRCMAGGGVDALLAGVGDRLPVVGEAKGVTDRNLFLGLIQALAYAVEFSTPSQRVRLDRTYPARFTWSADGPVLDIYLILAGTPKSQHHPNFLGLVADICESLLTPGTPVAGMVRRIVCLETDLSGSDEIPFSVAFHHPARL